MKLIGMAATMMFTVFSAQAQSALMVAPMQEVETVSATPQTKDALFAGTERFAKGAKDVTEVNMDQKSLAMMPSGGKNAEKAKKMDLIVVHTYTYEKVGMYSLADVETFRKRLDDGSWSCIVHEKSKDGSTDVCMRPGTDHETNEMVVITAEPLELTFVHMKGRMPMGDLTKMGAMGGDTPTPPAPPLKKR